MTTKKFSLLVITGCVLVFFLVTSAQKLPGSSEVKIKTDSTISVKEVYQFNQWLKDNASMSQYSKLTPEATLQELLNWKMQLISQAKKAVDTTKPKK